MDESKELQKYLFNEGFGTFYERLVRKEYLESLINLFEFKSVLEIKSGLGVDCLVFKDKQVNLVEYLPEYLIECKKLLAATWSNKKVEIIKANFFNLPFKQNSFDLVWSSSLIDDVPNLKALVFEMKRVSRKYVLLFASNDLHPTHIYSKFKKASVPWVDIRTLPRIFESCGLEIIDKGNIDSPPWPSGISLPALLKNRTKKPDSGKLDTTPIFNILTSFEKHIPKCIKIFTGHQVFVFAEKKL